MPALRRPASFTKLLRSIGVVGLALIGLTCQDGGLTGPGLPQRARLNVAPSFRTASEMPAIRLSKVKAEVFRLGSQDLLLTDSAFFAPGDTVLQLNLTVQMLRQDEQFRVRLSAWDDATPNNLVFQGEKTVHATPGTVAAGTASIPLSYTGPDTVVHHVRVRPQPDTVLTLGDQFTFRGTAYRADSTIVTANIGWTSRDTNVITIDRTTGVATAKAVGANVWIVATPFRGRQDSTRVTVAQAVASVTVTPSPATVSRGRTLQLVTSVKDAAGNVISTQPIRYTSADTTIAKVSATGTVLGVAVGSTVISVRSGNITATVTVNVILPPVFKVLIAPTDTTIYIGDAATLRSRVEDDLGNDIGPRTVLWASLNTSIATVDLNTGRVVGVTAGVATITATSEGKTGTTTVRVIPIGSIVLTPQSDTVPVGDSIRYFAVARDSAGAPLQNRRIAWSTVHPAIATVDSTGKVRGVALGVTQVIASSGGRADTSDVHVRPLLDRVAVTPTSATLTSIGDTITLTAKSYVGQTETPGTYTWISRDTSVAVVSSAGRVTARGNGSVFIVVIEATGVRDSSRITVQQRATTVTISPSATTALNALGLRVAYTATAYDARGNAIANALTWSSSNPSVVQLDSITATSARATSVANGTANIVATAHAGTPSAVSASATINVQQVLASLEVTPPAASVAPSGTVQLVVRGKDANNKYMSAGAVTWASSNTQIATVNSSGVVTGVALGTANVTATSGTIVSNASTINVTNAVTAVVSFGRDTIAVGRGTSTSIPLFLSRPSTSPVTVNLSAQDTVAYFSTATVTFPANTTAINVTLTGRNAGTTRVFASDASGTYGPDTAVVSVQANVRIATSSISLNQNDSFSTQVLLSDPSPAGGTYVAFTYSVAGIGSVSPDPAFIPAGQLAADIVVRAIGAGSTVITPRAAGVNGTTTNLHVAAPKLNFSNTITRLGVGQYDDGQIVHVPNYVNNAMTITLTSSDSTIARVSPSITIPKNGYYAAYEVRGLKTGSATVIASSQGWMPDTITVTVTTPRVGICCSTSMNTTSPVRTVTVYAQDSLRSSHNRITPLAVSLRSSDTSVIRVIDTMTTIAAGQYYNNTAKIAPAGAGTAWVYVTAPGHGVDSVRYDVIGPKISFGFTTLRIGSGMMSRQSVVVPDYVTAPLTITLTSADSNRVAVTQTVTIPAGSYYANFDIRGMATTTSPISILASASGYQPDTGTVTVTSPRVTSCCSTTINAFSAPRNFTIYSADSTGSTHILMASQRFTLVSSDTNVIKIDSAAVTIAALQYYNNSARITPVGVGTAKIYVTGPAGWIRDSSTVYTVVTPKLSASFNTNIIGRRQYTGQDFTISTPDYRPDTLRISVVQKHPQRVRLLGLDSGAVIPTGGYYDTFGYQGLAFGRDTIIFSAPGYLPDTAYVTVSSTKLITSGMPSAATTTTPVGNIYVYTADSVSRSQMTMDTVAIRVTSSDTNVVRPESTYIHIAPGESYDYVRVRFVGAGTATLTFTDSAGRYAPVTTGAVTVTGPSLRVNTTSSKVGMRQYRNDLYIYTDNYVTGSPVVVRLVSTDPRVATVTDSVIIPVGSYYAYFRVTGQDTVGTIQIQATATGYSPISTTLKVTRPKFTLSTQTTANTTTPPRVLTVYATDEDGRSHYVTENVTVTLSSSAPAVASTDSVTVVIPKDESYTQGADVRYFSAGTARITASDLRPVFYQYTPGSVDITVNTPGAHVSFNSFDLGVGQVEQPYVHLDDYARDTVTVTLTHLGTPETSTPTTVKVLPGTYYTYFRLVGTSIGRDSIVASAPGHRPDTGYVNVGTGTIGWSGWPTTMTVGQSTSLTLYTRDQSGGSHPVAAATTFNLSAANGNIAFFATASSTQPITSVTVPADGSSVNFYVRAISAGTSGVTVTNANYVTSTQTVTVQ